MSTVHCTSPAAGILYQSPVQGVVDGIRSDRGPGRDPLLSESPAGNVISGAWVPKRMPKFIDTHP
ncbi:MAG TPA: hypothetical protein VKT21_06260, partial [Thermoplasmata archaeon]|nr:hypothetical protein [Thermoplasmata archaeon]